MILDWSRCRIVPKPLLISTVATDEESGLPVRGAVNCAQLATIQQTGSQSTLRPPKGEAELRPIGRLSGEKLAEVEQALAYNLGLSGSVGP